jgi:hypothetical protein
MTSTSSSAPPTSASTTVASTTVPPAVEMRTKRYCELLLVHPIDGVVSADVYNTYPLNDCPEAAWQAIDVKAVATTEGVVAVLRNGPRYWLMDSVDKPDRSEQVRKTFGGIEMIKEATVAIGDANKPPYTPHAVTRGTIFTFDAGRTVYELHTPGGATYVMQTWSQQIDPKLGEADLGTLANRLKLPAGWTYTTRQLVSPMQVITVTTPANVLQDDLQNSYSQETS